MIATVTTIATVTWEQINVNCRSSGMDIRKFWKPNNSQRKLASLSAYWRVEASDQKPESAQIFHN
jgi:hypothetical protein